MIVIRDIPKTCVHHTHQSVCARRRVHIQQRACRQGAHRHRAPEGAGTAGTAAGGRGCRCCCGAWRGQGTQRAQRPPWRAAPALPAATPAAPMLLEGPCKSPQPQVADFLLNPDSHCVGLIITIQQHISLRVTLNHVSQGVSIKSKNTHVGAISSGFGDEGAVFAPSAAAAQSCAGTA